MIDLAEKTTLVAELVGRLRAELRTLIAAQKASHEGATHEEAKPENDKDTRALEQSYLARGQAERVVTLQADLDLMTQFRPRMFEGENQAIGLGAVIWTEDQVGKRQGYLLTPAGAGEQLESSAGSIKIVTPRSPLGRALMRRHVGDDVEINSPTGKRTLSIEAIC